MRWTLRIITVIVGFHVAAGTAFAFNPNTLLSDEDMTTPLFSLSQTISFLRAKGGFLGSRAESYGQQIYDAATQSGLNPQFLIVQIQKESSLIEDPNPSQRRIDYALFYGCPDNGPCNPAFQGFGAQVTHAAAIFRTYLTDLATKGRTISGWAVGVPKRAGAPRNKANQNDSHWELLNGQPVFVTPTNAATAAMYTYNPWVGGHDQPGKGYIGANYNFTLIWDRYFNNTRVYPDGALLRARGDATIWVIADGVRKPFLSQAAFLASYDPRKVITVPAAELEMYVRGPGIKFAEGSLLQAPSGGVYLITNGAKRPITSRAAFRAVGFNPEEVVRADWDDLAAFSAGEPITVESQAPTGRLVQINDGGIVYVDEHNLRHAIYSREIYQSAFRHRKPMRGSLAALTALPQGDPIRFRDGELVGVKGGDGIYLISDGQRRPIPSKEIFTAYRFRWRNIVWTNQRSLDAHPRGEPLGLKG